MNYDNFIDDHSEKIKDLFNIFPVGMMIFAKITSNKTSEYEMKYINETALKIFRQRHTRSEEDIKETLKKFNKLQKFSTLDEVYSNMNDVTEENLYNRIFDDLNKTETEICERYISKEIMIYVKIKIHQEYKLVTIENFNDERVAIQNNIIKNIKTQYLLTLSHELNNPLNSLAHSVNEVISTQVEVKDKKENKKLINGIKVSTDLIKFFIKNFIFCLRMSFDASTIEQHDKVEGNKKEDCVNLKYVLKKIKEKYSILFRSKKIKIECNFNPIEYIFTTYDFDYFKSMIKNIFMYLFYRIDRKKGIKIEFEFDEELKILFKKVINKNSSELKSKRQKSKLDTIFVKELDIESSVKTSKIIYDIIKKFADMIGVRVTIIEEESPCYLILYLKYDMDDYLSQRSQDLAEEYTYRNSKKKNLMQMDKSISGLFNIVANDNRKSEINKSRNTVIWQNDMYFTEPTLCVACESGNMVSKSLFTKMKIKQNDLKEEEENQNMKEHKNKNKLERPRKKSSKINKNQTNLLFFKESSTINSSDYSVIDNDIYPDGNKKPVVMRSGYSSKYTNFKSFENELGVISDLISEKTNQFSLNNNCMTNKFLPNFQKNIGKETHENAIKNKFNSKTFSSNKNTNSNISSINGSLISQDSIEPIIKMALNSSFVKLTNPIKKATSKFKAPTKIISTLTRNNSKITKNEQINVSFINHLPQKLNTNPRLIQPPMNKNIDILVVDDDKFNLKVLQSMLTKLKLSSDTCMNGLECLNKLKSKYEKGSEYKLILMDVMMPIMNGIEASTKIEALINDDKLNSNISIIIISAHNNKDIIDKATQLYAVKEFVSKPVKKSDVERIIKQYYI